MESTQLICLKTLNFWRTTISKWGKWNLMFFRLRVLFTFNTSASTYQYLFYYRQLYFSTGIFYGSNFNSQSKLEASYFIHCSEIKHVITDEYAAGTPRGKGTELTMRKVDSFSLILHELVKVWNRSISPRSSSATRTRHGTKPKHWYSRSQHPPWTSSYCSRQWPSPSPAPARRSLE